MNEDVVRVIEEQEANLRFKDLDLAVITKVCDEAVSILERLKAPCYIRAAVNGTVVYARCLNGASLNNQEWARRKAALCERYWISSLHVVHNMTAGGKTLESCGMSASDYGFSGGSFPILLPSGICVGSVTVSGLKGEEDHQVVATAMAHVLGLQIPSVVPYFEL